MKTFGGIIQHADQPPSERILDFLKDQSLTFCIPPSHKDEDIYIVASQICQLRFVKALWKVMVARFGASNSMQELATQIYLLVTTTYKLSHGKVEDEVNELLVCLSEVESGIALDLLKDKTRPASMKYTFWTIGVCKPEWLRSETLLKIIIGSPMW